ncbi:NapC/NirT family cytochrome c [Pontibacter beigongshangensis]|uniref:NapC/NirT family cytochrome c n=1 Tax=Pontibacter beigongshangensis TaxID=2574733 RepID=UPI0016504223|nr:NapC/NirT family cytochrome c [Pontibacter beigongshangensis]
MKTTFRKAAAALVVLFPAGILPAFCYPEEEKGLSAAALLQQIGIVATIMALVGLILVEFFLKKRISRGSYKWALFVGLFMLPVISILSSTTTLMHETTTVASCNSCHIMEPFVNDMQNEQSPTLAARHFKNKWITTDQCYHCHTSYGIHGTAESKRDGFRHWLMYVTDTWPEPITFKGSYPNSNCLTCHGETKNFREVNSHVALRDKLSQNEVSCSSCHGPVHPTPLERETPARSAQVWLETGEKEQVEALSVYMKQLAASGASH